MESRDEVIDIDDAPSGALTTQPRANQIARQDFGGSSLAATTGATEALVAKARASVEARVIAAKRWPRHMAEARQTILAECKRTAFAHVAMYARPVGKKKDERTGQWTDVLAEGLTIRAAEMMMRALGNMEASSETIYDDATMRIVRVVVVDYQTNATWQEDLTVQKTVERRQLKKSQRPLGERLNSYGDRVFIVEATDDEVHVRSKAMISKASRSGILRLVPGDLQDEAKALVMATRRKEDAADPTAARNRVFDAFAAIGVRPTALEEYLGHPVDSMSPAEREKLLLVHSAIKEGETTWAKELAEQAAAREDERENPAPPRPAPPAPAAQPSPAPPPRQNEPAVPLADLQREARPASAPRQSTGKGTAALKGALTKPAPKPEPAPVTVPRPADDDEDPEPAWAGPAEVPPGTPPPPPGFEDRKCASPTCNATVEVEIGTPPGVRCYACSQA
jgi:hypothetical protein